MQTPQAATGLRVAKISIVLRPKNTIRLGLTMAVGLWQSGRNDASALLIATLGVLDSSLLLVDARFDGNRRSPCTRGSHRPEDLLRVQGHRACSIARLVGVYVDE
jgi:hypothetical protein